MLQFSYEQSKLLERSRMLKHEVLFTDEVKIREARANKSTKMNALGISLVADPESNYGSITRKKCKTRTTLPKLQITTVDHPTIFNFSLFGDCIEKNY